MPMVQAQAVTGLLGSQALMGWYLLRMRELRARSHECILTPLRQESGRIPPHIHRYVMNGHILDAGHELAPAYRRSTGLSKARTAVPVAFQASVRC